MDDTNAVVSASNTEQLATKVQKVSENIEQYLDDNLLQVNKEKSKLLVNHPPNQDSSIIIINTSDKPIKPQQTLKLLGAYISADLSWNYQVSILMKQLNYRLNTLKMIAHYCSMKTLKSIAQSIIISKILYTIQLWGGCQQYLRQRIQSIMLKAAKLVLGRGAARLSTAQILHKIGWQGIDQTIASHTLRLAVREGFKKKK